MTVDSTNSSEPYRIGTEFLLAGKAREAFDALSQAYDESSEDPRILYNLIVAACANGLRERALELAPNFYVNDETKFPGDIIEAGDFLCELEFEKCAIGIESPVSGVVTNVFVQDEAEVQPGQLLYEVVTDSPTEETLKVALAILSNRFPDSVSQFEEILPRVEKEKLLNSFPVLGRGTKQEIVLALAVG